MEGNKKEPLISIIIPTFNRATLLKERSLPSVLNQTYKNFECIIVDDGSTDDTEKVTKEFIKKDSRIKYIKLPKNCGAATAANIGIKNSKGKYISILDDDDEFLPNFLKETFEKLNRLPQDFGGVCCASFINYGKNNLIYSQPTLSSFYIPISVGWLLRREVFSEKNLFFDEQLSSDADADLGIRFFKEYKAEIIKKPLVIRHAETNRKHLSEPSEKRLNELKKFLEKNERFFKEANKKDLAWLYLFAGRNFCLGKKMKEGKKYFWQSLKIKFNLRIFFHLLSAYLGFTTYQIYWKLERKLAILIQILKSSFLRVSQTFFTSDFVKEE